MPEDKLKMAVDVCSYLDEGKQQIHLEICVPGVKKDAINLKMRDDRYILFATRDDFEYVSAAAFCCPVNSKKAKASYKDGILKVTVPLRDTMEDAHVIKIR